MDIPIVGANDIAWVTTAQMVEVDRIMIEDLHIELMQMMENAGRNLAQLAVHRYSPSSAVVCAGSGGNGGGGLVAARHLHVAGVNVKVVLSTSRDRFGAVPAHQLDIVERMGIPIVDSVPNDAELILDAVIGYSLEGAPRARAADVIEQIHVAAAPALSLDTPSGLDTTSGAVHDPHVSADATLTLAAPKHGLRDQQIVGDLFVGNISVPASVFDLIGTGRAPNFSTSPVLSIET